MTEYSELVKKLRDLHRDPRPASAEWLFDNQVALYDAAAAIEALQAEVEKWTFNATLEQSKAIANFESYCKLKAQLPNRGEWIEDTTTYAGPGLSNYKCSLCGKICGTWRRGLEPSELPNWCGNCGADMRKMEVQE